MSDKTIRVGFVGAGGNCKKHHIPKLKAQPGVEIVAVANRSKESGERVAKEFGIPRVAADWREVMSAPDIDAICIGTWPYMHRELVLAALEADKHVLCEARMAMNAAEGRQMLDAAKKKPHLVAQLVPGPPTLELDATIARFVREGYVGDVLSVELSATQQARFAEQGEAMHWRQNIALSGNNVLNMGIWYETMMRWVGTATHVMAKTKIALTRRKDDAGVWQDVKVPDHVDILATLRTGGVAHLRFSSITAFGPPADAWIFGSEGTLHIEPDAKRLSGARRGDTALAEIHIPAAQRIGWRVEEEFVNAIRGKEKIALTTFEDGVRYMEFTDAVAKSAATDTGVAVATL